MTQAVSPSGGKLPEKRVLVNEVVVQGVTGKLQELVYQTIVTKPGYTSTRSRLQEDINAIFKTGWFSNVKALPEDTSSGVRVTFIVQLNPVLRQVKIVPVSGNKSVLPISVVDDIFRSQYGDVLNLQTLQAGIEKLKQWYQNNGYTVAQVLDRPKISKDGVVTLQVAEGVIESVRVQFVTANNKPVTADNKPVIGKTPTSVILQSIKSKPGMLFNHAQVEKDLKQILDLNLVKKAEAAVEPAENDRKIILVLKVQEIFAPAETEPGIQRVYSPKELISEAASLRTLARSGADIALYQKALKLSQAAHDRAGEADALEGMAYVYNSQAKFKADSNNNNNAPPFDKAKKNQAISTYQAALKIYQESNNGTQAAIVLRNIGFIFEELENYSAAINTYRKAIPLFQKLKQPFWQALTLNNLAANYRKVGEIDQSLKLQQQALKLWQFLREHPNQLESSSLFSRLDKPGDRKSWMALSWERSSKTGSQSDFKLYLGVNYLSNGGLTDVYLAEGMTLLNISSIFQFVGDYQQALYTLKTALSLFQNPSITQPLIQNRSGSQEDQKLLLELIPETINAGGAFLISTLYTDMGWQKQAQSYRAQAIAKLNNLLEKTLQKVAIKNTQKPELNSLLPVISTFLNSLLINVGSNSSTQQFNQTIIDWLNQSLPIFQQYIAKQPEYQTQWKPLLPWIDVFYNYAQGEELTKANKLPQAADAYRKALTQWKNLSPRDLQTATIHLDFQSTTTNLSATSTIESLGIMPIILKVFDQAGYVFYAKTYTALGKVLFAMNQSQESIEAHQQAVKILQAGNDRISKTKLSRPQPANAFIQFWQSLWPLLWSKVPDTATADAFSQLGKAYAANHQPALALESYSRALPLWRKANDILQEADTDWEMAIVQRQQGNLAQAKMQIETAIERIESDKAQISYQKKQQGSDKPPVSQKPNPYKSYLNLADYLASKHNYYAFYIDLLMQLHQQSPTTGYDELAFQASERSHARSLRGMLNRTTRSNATNSSTASPANLQAIQLAQPLPLKDLQQQLLDTNTILLEYALGEERSYLWAVTQKDLQTFTLPKQSEIEAVSKEFIELLLSPSYRIGDRRGANPQIINRVQIDAADQLSQMLLEPIADQLGNKRLFIVSDGILHYLPFAALPKPGTEGKNQVPLLVDHEIVGLPSASLRIGLQPRTNAKAASQTLAILADPIFRLDDQRLPQHSRLSDVETIYPRLLGTRQEASQIAELVPSAKRLLKLDAAASRQIAISPELAKYRMVHIASHGILDSQNPARSGMVLSVVDNQGNLQRSLLSTADAFNLKLSANLVVLSGCTTALGKEIQGEGLIGLTGGLMYSGAKQVVAGLWNVDDDSTALLMTQFYQGMLRQNLSPTAALRTAQLKLWQSQDWQAPYYWAAFALQGS